MDIWQNIHVWLTSTLFTVGGKEVSASSLLFGMFAFSMAMVVSAVVQRLLSFHLMKRLRIQAGLAYAIRRFVHYLIMVLGLVVAVQSVGLELSSIAIVLGFLSVGIGFGLQNITSNFISGLILLLERPVSVGDMVRVGDQVGTVSEIRMRSTLIATLDNVTIIVPNSKLIEDEVVNWSHGDSKVRIHVPVGVAYGSDMEAVVRAMEGAARAHPEVLAEPKPEVRFLEFGDSSLNMDLLVWVPRPQAQFHVKSQLNFAIDAAFRAAGIEIPFPQRDLNLKLTEAVERLAGKAAE